MKCYPLLLFPLLLLSCCLLGSCSTAQESAENDAVGIPAHLAQDEMHTSMPKWTFTPSAKTYSSVSSKFSQHAATSSKLSSSSSASISPSTSFEVFSTTSSPVSSALGTSSAMMPLESSSAPSIKAVSFHSVIPNDTSVSKSDLKVIKTFSIPLCHDGNGTSTDNDCYDPVTVMNFTCYSNARNISMCFLDNLVRSFPESDVLFSHVKSLIRSHPDLIYDVCVLTATLLYNISLRDVDDTFEAFGLKYDLVGLDYKNLTNVCLPIFESFANCTKSRFLTSTCVTHDRVVVFLPTGCWPPPTLPRRDVQMTIMELLLFKEFREIKAFCEGYSENFGKGEELSSVDSLHASRPHDSDFEIYAFRIELPCLKNPTDCLVKGKYVQYIEGNTKEYITCYRNNNSFNICLKEKPLNTLLSNEGFYNYVSNILNKSSVNLILACLNTANIDHTKVYAKFLHHDKFGLKHLLIYEERLVSVCHPLFEKFSSCASHGMVTICMVEDISVSFFVGGCKLPTIPAIIVDRALAELVVFKQFDEIKKTCDGNLVNVEESTENLSNTFADDAHVEDQIFEIVFLAIRPPCQQDDTGFRSSTGSYERHCHEGNDTLYITCYASHLSFELCLKGKPVTSFASNEQFETYAKSTLGSQQDITEFCVQTASLHLDFEFRVSKITIGRGKYLLLHDVDVSKICLPIFRYFGLCLEPDEIIICEYNELIIIVLPGGCDISPTSARDVIDQILIHLYVNNNIRRIKDFCNGRVQIYEENASGNTAVLIPQSVTVPHLRFSYQSVNNFWPCCYSKYSVVWLEDPKPSGLSKNWSYLPTECKVGEIFLMIFQGASAFMGLTGNFIVLAVMFNGGHRGEASSFLRTSLSIADFLLSAFVMIPSLFDSLAIINDSKFETYVYKSSFDKKDYYLSIPYAEFETKNSYITLPDNDFNASFISQMTIGRTPFPFYNYENGWFQVIRGQMLPFCSCVAMITMSYLSVERFVLCWRPLKYKRLFLMGRVKKAIFIAWSFGLISSVVISIGDSFTVYWNSWAKLLFGTHNNSILYNKPIQVISVILCVSGISTFIMSVLALIAFLKEQDKVREERKEMNIRITDEFEKENLYITITLVLVTAFFLLAHLPVGINVFIENDNFRLTLSPIFTFCSWWLLLGGSAVNPFVYNFRSRIFRSELAELVEKLLPESQKSNMKPYITHPRKPVERFLKSLDKDAQATGESHDGLPKGSKLARLGLGFDKNQSDRRREEEELNVGESVL